MKLGVIPENLLERIAHKLGLAPTPLSDTHLSFLMARTIMVATKLGFFEVLQQKPLPANEVAKQSGTQETATVKLLNTLVHLGYMQKNKEKYSLTPLSRKWLLKDSANSLHDKMMLQFLEWKMAEHYEDFVKTGEPLNMHQTFQEKEWGLYQKGMRSVASTSAWEIGRRTPIPRNAQSLLDIGGSHGYYAVALCRRHPMLSATILDLPEAVQHAEKILAQENMGQRVCHQAGNALTTDLGEEKWDVVFVASLVHHFDEETNRTLSQKIARALRPGGFYIVQDFIRDNQPRKGDHMGALLDMYFAATSESGTWTVQEIASWQKDAGLLPKKTVWLRTVPRHAQVVAMKPLQ